MFLWEVTLTFILGTALVDVTFQDIETESEFEDVAERFAVSRLADEFPGATNISVLDVVLLEAPEEEEEEEEEEDDVGYVPYVSRLGTLAQAPAAGYAPYRTPQAPPQQPQAAGYTPIRSTAARRPVAHVERLENGYVPLRQLKIPRE
jgi:hypothetical protein